MKYESTGGILLKYNFDEIVNRRNTYSLKWDGGDLLKEIGFTTRYDENTIPLFTADMDLPVSQPIIDALHDTVNHHIFGYSIITNEYYEAIQSWFERKYQWKIEQESIIYCPGTVHALNVAVKAFTKPNDGIIIQRPVYPPFTSAIENNNRVVINNAMLCDEEGYYTIDFVDFEEKAQHPTTTMFILCNPHNPTGRIFSNQDLEKLAFICKENNVLIVADEIHGDLIRQDTQFTPIACIAESNTPIVTLTAINKTFNVAGLHCTNVVIEDEALRNTFKSQLGYVQPTPFAIATLIAAYTKSDEWLDQLKTYIDDTIDWTLEFIATNLPLVKVYKPEGTYIMWMDFSGYGLTPEEVHDRIYNQANVLLEDGHMFGEEGRNYQRICLPSPRPVIEEAFERIARAFQDVDTTTTNVTK